MTQTTKFLLGPEIAVVLGSGIQDGGKPGPRTTLRAEAAAKLALERPELTIIASGDGRSSKQQQDLTEAQHIAKILEQKGVASDRVLIESESHDTIGNALLTYLRFLREEKPRKIYVVTSPFHVTRALLCFRGVLGPDWEIEAYPCAVDAGDAKRTETDFSLTNQFFAGVKSGDTNTMIARLNAAKAVYRANTWLQAEGDKAA